VGWWDRLVWRRVEQREQLTLEGLLADQGTPTHAGVPVTTDQALRLSAVWSCVRLLADCISTLPLHAFRGDEQLPELPPLLRQPAAATPLHDWLYQIVVSMLTRGNTFGIVTGRSGATMLPSQVEIAHPDRVGASVNGDGTVTWRLNGEEIDPADLWHVRAYSFPGSVLGLSPIEYARQTLGLAAEKFGAQFFGEGATPSGVLTSDQRITRSWPTRSRPAGTPSTRATGISPCSARVPVSSRSASARTRASSWRRPRRTWPRSPASTASRRR
jgi:phage portal protein BeeE